MWRWGCDLLINIFSKDLFCVYGIFGFVCGVGDIEESFGFWFFFRSLVSGGGGERSVEECDMGSDG